MAIHDRYEEQGSEIQELKNALARREEDLKVAREACDLYQADFGKAEQERQTAKNRARNAEEALNALRATRAQEVEAAGNKGYNEGFDEVTVEYKKQVREIEVELHGGLFRDGFRYGYELLLNRFVLPEDSELRVIPEPPLEELVLPEEEGGEVPNPEDQANLADQADPNADVAPDA